LSVVPLPAAPLRPVGPGAIRLVRLVRRHPEAVIGAGLLALMLFVSLAAPLLGAGDPRALSVAERLAAPSPRHLFGTDELGRDLYARALYGGRISLAVGFFAALFSAFLGALIGVIGGSSRRLDDVLMRIMDGLMSIPSILLAIALMAVAGASVQNVILAVTVVETPRVARLVRSVVLSIRELSYVEAAIAAGSSPSQIIVRHYLPGIWAPLAVQATFLWGAAMLIEAALSFIGAGTPPSIPSWGNIMAAGKSLWQVRPGLIFIPAIFLSATVLGVNLLGDGLRKALDPKTRGGM